MIAIAVPAIASRPEAWSPLWISLATAMTATVVNALLGIVVARWMTGYSGRWRGLLNGLLTLPLVLPPTVVGFVLLVLLGTNSPVGRMLQVWGISIIFSWSAVAIAATVVAFPLMYKSALGAFDQVDATLINAARTLGASEWRLFWQVMLPLSWPGLLSGIVLTFARAFGEFGATLMVGGSIPGVTQTIPMAIFFASEAGQTGVALAWVGVMVVVSLLAIAAITASQGQGTMAQPRWMTPWFNGIYFGQFSPVTSKNGRDMARLWPDDNAFSQSRTFSHSRHRSDPFVSPNHPDLQVAIANRIPGFQLQVRFSTGRSPLGLLGASGSGKTMTLRCIAGLETPSDGKIILNGRTLFDSQTGVNIPSCDRRVGLLFQNYALFPHLTVAQNVAFGMPEPRQNRLAQVNAALAQFGLEGLGDRYPRQLSGGQQQRVALARALASHPQVLLLDEPLSALDTYLRSRTEQTLMAVLSQYDGVTLFVTHKLEEVYRVCPRLVVLSQGRILAAGHRDEVFTNPKTLEVARVTECKNVSRAQRISAGRLRAIDWDCDLQIQKGVPSDVAYVGVRAHHIQFSDHAHPENTFPGWLAAISNTQHRVTLYIKLHSSPESAQDYHLQAEVYREKWRSLEHRPFPWPIYLNPSHVMMMRK